MITQVASWISACHAAIKVTKNMSESSGNPTYYNQPAQNVEVNVPPTGQWETGVTLTFCKSDTDTLSFAFCLAMLFNLFVHTKSLFLESTLHLDLTVLISTFVGILGISLALRGREKASFNRCKTGRQWIVVTHTASVVWWQIVRFGSRKLRIKCYGHWATLSKLLYFSLMVNVPHKITVRLKHCKLEEWCVLWNRIMLIVLLFLSCFLF